MCMVDTAYTDYVQTFSMLGAGCGTFSALCMQEAGSVYAGCTGCMRCMECPLHYIHWVCEGWAHSMQHLGGVRHRFLYVLNIGP